MRAGALRAGAGLDCAQTRRERNSTGSREGSLMMIPDDAGDVGVLRLGYLYR